MRKLSRREFLKLSAAAVGGSLFFDPDAAEAGEGDPVPRAIGKFIDRSTGQVYGDDLAILGVNGYHYIVQTKNGARYYPIESIQTLNRDDFPFESIVQSDRLGFRSDDIRFAHMLQRTGGKWDRIAGPTEDLYKGSWLDNAIAAAENNNMRVMVVANPGWPRSDDYYKATIDYLMSSHPGALVELGNEMDNRTPGYEFWQSDDPYNTFAHFIKVCQDHIYQKDPSYQPIVGALVDVVNTETLLTAMVNAGVNLSHLQYGVHAYQSSEDLPNRLWQMRKAFKKFNVSPKIHCTELGAQYPYLQKGVLLNMIQRAYQTEVESIIIHQLYDHPEGGQTYGFGVVSTDWTMTYPIFMQINAFVRLLQKGVAPQVYAPAAGSTKAPTKAPTPAAKPAKTPTPFYRKGQE